MTYGGTNQTAPFTTSAAIGFQTAISAADQFSTGGATYAFASWSDGGARARNYTVPATDTTLTASYRVTSGIPVSTAPQGNWVGAYGASGYALGAWNGESDLASLPNATLSQVQGERYIWSSSTSDVRALQSPDKSTRKAATWYEPFSGTMKLKLSFSAAYSGNLRLYALDWDAQGRREAITVNDGSGPRTANLSSDFSQGAWVTVPVTVAAGGSVSIDVALTAGLNPVLSGVFLGEASTPPPPPPPVTVAPQGSWVGAHGASGYALGAWNGESDLSSLANASLTQTQGQRYIWSSSTSDVRALQSPDKATRKAATWYDGDTGTVKLKLSFSAAYNGNLWLYALDWDAKARREAITVNDGSGDRTVNLSSDFSQGAWVSTPINVAAGGSVTITVTRTGGLNAVLSGVFLN